MGSKVIDCIKIRACLLQKSAKWIFLLALCSWKFETVEIEPISQDVFEHLFFTTVPDIYKHLSSFSISIHLQLLDISGGK